MTGRNAAALPVLLTAATALALLGWASQRALVPPLPTPSWALLFVAEWVLMTLAMMLPSTVPFIDAVRLVGGASAARAAALAYVMVWALLGVAVCFALWFAGNWLALLPEATLRTPAALSLFTAAAYQVSPWARRCQRQCARPFSVLARQWQGRHSVAVQALASGVHYGLTCIGCCVAMVAMMLVLGVHDLGWMLMLALVMVFQKHARWGARVGQGTAVIAALAGCALLAGWWTPALSPFQALCRA